MIEIGKTKLIRRKSRKTGEMIERVVSAVVKRVTRDKYGYGRHRRQLVVTLEQGDLITIKPFKFKSGGVSATIGRLYEAMMQWKADAAWGRKMAEKRARKQERLARQRQISAEKRFIKRCKEDND